MGIHEEPGSRNPALDVVDRELAKVVTLAFGALNDLEFESWLLYTLMDMGAIMEWEAMVVTRRNDTDTGQRTLYISAQTVNQTIHTIDEIQTELRSVQTLLRQRRARTEN